MKSILIAGAVLDRDRVPLYRGRGYRLFKTLYSSACRMDCRYCPFSCFSRVERESWDRESLVSTFLSSYRAGRVDGLFLTSSIYADPDTVVERQLEVLAGVRRRGYTGYIHLRLMPGVSRSLVSYAALLADRAGLNIEAPRSVFGELAPSKGDWLQDIVKRIEWLVQARKRLEERRGPGCLSRGIDTQLVLGAAGESDLEVLETAWMLLRIGVNRIYVSRFKPFKTTPLEHRPPEKPSRALRVMQAIELMRAYRYNLHELKQLLDENNMLPNMDPKVLFAEANPGFFPVDPNTDPEWRLLRVPGIGPRTARMIIRARDRGEKITWSTLEKIMGRKRLMRAAKYLVL